MKSKTASFLSIRSNTSLGIIFRTVFVIAAFYESFITLNRGIHLFAPLFWPIYLRTEILWELAATAVFLVVTWAVILLPEKRPWADVGWARQQLASSLLVGGLVGSGMYVCYVIAIQVCGWFRIVGHYAWTNIPIIFLFTFLYALGRETLFRGYLLNWLEQRMGTLRAIVASSLIYGMLQLVGWQSPSVWDHSHTVSFVQSCTTTVILYSARGIFYGAAYVWNRRLWTSVGVHWGCSCMDDIWTYSGRFAGASSVFRYTITDHAFSFTGPGLWFKTASFCLAGILMLRAAKRRGNWLERPSRESQT